ncbi:hypothetical protein Emag_007237 [Eimeria magna]
MQSSPHTRSRTEREEVVEVEPPHSVASQQTVQLPSPAAALLAAAPSTPVARKRQRAEPAEPRIVKFVALGGLLAPRARHDEEDSDEVVEARPALPTPASSGVSAELEGSAELSPLPAARAPGSARAGPQPAPASPAAPAPVRSVGQGPLPPLSPTTTAAVNALGNLAFQGWDLTAPRCVWWTLAAAREYRTARESFEYRLQELQWIDSMSRTVAAARAMLTSLPRGQSSVAGPRGAVSRPHGPGQNISARISQRGIPCGSAPAGNDGGYQRAFTSGRRAGGASPAGPVCTARRAGPSLGSTRHPRKKPHRRRPCPTLSAEEFRLPESSVTARDPPQQLGMDGLLNGYVGSSPADDGSAPTANQEKGSAAELSEREQPAPKCGVPRGGDLVQLR